MFTGVFENAKLGEIDGEEWPQRSALIWLVDYPIGFALTHY